MSDSRPLIYGLEFQSRCLTGMFSNDDTVRFAAGTQFLRSKNQIHILNYSDENHDVKNQVFNHEYGEIWDLSSCNNNPDVLIATYQTISEDFSSAKFKAHIIKIPDNDGDPLIELTELPTNEIGNVKQVLSSPAEDSNDLVALIDGFIVLMSHRDSGEYEASNLNKLEGRGYPKFTVGSWSPHHGSKIVTAASDSSIYSWDLRSMKISCSIENAHSQLIRDIDYNPNRQYFVVSAGDDCKIKIWDLRSSKQPVHEIHDHTHWVWSVRYNPFHDQLILSGGSDSLVALHMAQSVSSEAAAGVGMTQQATLSDDDDGDDDEEELEKVTVKDGLINMYEEHEDSVYAVSWSPVDPWMCASLSYDGRLVINQVPKNVKYNILL